MQRFLVLSLLANFLAIQCNATRFSNRYDVLPKHDYFESPHQMTNESGYFQSLNPFKNLFKSRFKSNNNWSQFQLDLEIGTVYTFLFNGNGKILCHRCYFGAIRYYGINEDMYSVIPPILRVNTDTSEPNFTQWTYNYHGQYYLYGYRKAANIPSSSEKRLTAIAIIPKMVSASSYFTIKYEADIPEEISVLNLIHWDNRLNQKEVTIIISKKNYSYFVVSPDTVVSTNANGISIDLYPVRNLQIQDHVLNLEAKIPVKLEKTQSIWQTPKSRKEAQGTHVGEKLAQVQYFPHHMGILVVIPPVKRNLANLIVADTIRFTFRAYRPVQVKSDFIVLCAIENFCYLRLLETESGRTEDWLQ